MADSQTQKAMYGGCAQHARVPILYHPCMSLASRTNTFSKLADHRWIEEKEYTK